MSELLIALVDMDNTLVDHNGQLMKDLEDLRAPGESNFKVDETWPPHIKARARLIKSQKGWWSSLPKLDLGWKIYDLLVELEYTINILTKGPNNLLNAWTEKAAWCHEHLTHPQDCVTITGDKSSVMGSVLVDDYPDFMQRWLEKNPEGRGVMPSHSYNESYKDSRVIKYNGENTEEVRELLMAIKSKGI